MPPATQRCDRHADCEPLMVSQSNARRQWQTDVGGGDGQHGVGRGGERHLALVGWHMLDERTVRVRERSGQRSATAAARLHLLLLLLLRVMADQRGQQDARPGLQSQQLVGRP
jgi:hypothetical protein